MMRGLLTAACGCLVAMTLTMAATPNAHASIPSSWLIPYPFGTNVAAPSTDDDRAISRPVAAFKAAGPMGSYAQFKGLRWRGWGRDRAVATGQGRYCDNRCPSYSSIRLELFGRQRLCEPSRYFYKLYRFKGLPGLFNGRTLHSGSLSDC